MTESHFYVEAARRLALGSAALGTKPPSELPAEEGLLPTAGRLIGSGFNDTGTDLLVDATARDDSLLRKCAHIGLTFHSPSENTLRALRRGFEDRDIEVRKVAIVGYGLALIGSRVTDCLEASLRDPEWKVRAAAGLALSSILIQNGNPWPMVERLKKERSPYVRVCSCWQVSLAHACTQDGASDYRELLSWRGESNSFFRDMACLGLGLSYLGTGDATCLSLLLEAMHDPHPYVRESACFGVALLFAGSGNGEAMALLKAAVDDESSVVRSGASLGLGILRMGLQADASTHSYADESALWGQHLGHGLQLGPSLPLPTSNYARWGHYIGEGLRPAPYSEAQDLSEESAFFSPIQRGMSQMPITKDVRAHKLIVPGYMHYLLYDSFWWGLWVLSAIGMALKVGMRE